MFLFLPLRSNPVVSLHPSFEMSPFSSPNSLPETLPVATTRPSFPPSNFLLAPSAALSLSSRAVSCPEIPAILAESTVASTPSRAPEDETPEFPKLLPTLLSTPRKVAASTKSDVTKVLIVDDNHMNQHLLQTMLTRLVLFFPYSFFSNFLFSFQTSKRHYS
jgi:hypothetical protein